MRSFGSFLLFIGVGLGGKWRFMIICKSHLGGMQPFIRDFVVVVNIVQYDLFIIIA
jgi:hypothetical protein